jgi:hypothetical protein
MGEKILQGIPAGLSFQTCLLWLIGNLPGRLNELRDETLFVLAVFGIMGSTNMTLETRDEVQKLQITII